MSVGSSVNVVIPRRQSNAPIYIPLSIYITLCVLRILLTPILSPMFVLSNDEIMFVNLARSTHNFAAHFQTQPIPNMSLLYPLILSHLYFLPKSIDIVTAMRVLNTLLMNLAIFPAFYLTTTFSSNKKLATVVSVIAGIIAETAMSHMILAENVIYPLTMFAMLAFVRSIYNENYNENSTRYTRNALLSALCGVLSVAAYFAKVGYAALPVACLIGYVYVLITNKTKHNIILILSFVLSSAAAYIALNALFSAMQQVDASSLTLYSNQLKGFDALTSRDIWKILYGFASMLIMLVVTTAFTPIAALTCYGGTIEDGNNIRVRRAFTLVTVVGTIAIALGMAYSVFLPEPSLFKLIDASSYHRYVFPFALPFVILAATLPNAERQTKATIKLITLGVLAVVGILFMYPLGDVARVNTQSLSNAALTFVSFASKRIITITAAALCVIVCAYIHWKGYGSKARYVTLAAIIVWSVACNAAFYKQYSDKQDDPPYADIVEAAAYASEGRSLLVAPKAYYINAALQRVSALSRVDMPMSSIQNTPAIIPDSFIPERIWREVPSRPVSVDRLIIPSDALDDVVLAESVMKRYTVNNEFVMIDVEPGKPWKRASSYGISNRTVTIDAGLDVYDVKQGDIIKLELTFEAAIAQKFVLRMGDESLEYEFEPGVVTISPEFIATEDGDMRIVFDTYGELYFDGVGIR